MDSLPVNAFDLVVVAVLVISGIIAFFRGFVHEVLAIGAWVGAALATLYGLPHLRPVAREYIPLTWAADLAAGAAIFLIVLMVLALMTRALSRRVQNSALGALDRSLGFLFGLARGALVVAVGFLVVAWLWPDPDDRPAWMAEARSLPLVEDGARVVGSLMPETWHSEAERARTAARETEDSARQAIELKQTLDRLAQPQPAAPSTPAETPQTAPVAAPSDSGYGAAPRQDLDRLIESQINR